MSKNMYGPLGLPPPLDVPLELVKAFCIIIARHTSQRREIERALLIFELIKFNPSETARRLGCNREKAYRIRFVYTPKHCSWRRLFPYR